jgi:hypothetical protein
MRRALSPHPDFPAAAVTSIAVEAVRPMSSLELHFVVAGRIAELSLPPAETYARADALWEHTCFEAFVRPGPGEAYYELNFAPSTQWQAYWLSGYRSGMTVATEIGQPLIETRSSNDTFELWATLDLAPLPSDTLWQIGLSAVIEETNGRKSWWALAHPPGAPDFHHRDCFSLELPAATRS